MTYTLCTIAVRGGSKGVPGKNLRVVAGHPLVAYTIAQALACTFVDRVIVSTDSPEIADVARIYGAEVPFLRPAELARDDSPKIPVLQHAVRQVERSMGRHVDVVIDLDATAPLRTPADIRACWETLLRPQTDLVFSVYPADKNPYFNMVELEDGYARLSKAAPAAVTRRQDAPAVYAMNASIYAWRRDHLMEDGRLFGPRTRVHVMSADTHDIDSPLDLAFLEFLVREGHVSLPEPRKVPVRAR